MVPRDEVLLTPPAGKVGCFGAPLLAPGELRPGVADVVVVGIPCEAGSLGRHGPARAPASLREASREVFLYREDAVTTEPLGAIDLERRELVLAGVRMRDLGDLVLPEGADPATVAGRAREVVARITRVGAIPVVLGGDHSVSAGVVGGLAEAGDLGVLVLDAHLDTAPRADVPLTHATWIPVARREPAVRQLVHVGARGWHPPTADFRRRLAAGVTPAEALTATLASGGIDHMVPSAELVDRGGEAILPALSGGLRWHVSLDVDVLDPAAVPTTPLPVPLGPQPRELALLLEGLGRRVPLAGIDVVEYAPLGITPAADRTTMALVVRLLAAALPADRG